MSQRIRPVSGALDLVRRRASSGELLASANGVGRAEQDWELAERAKRAVAAGGNASARPSPRLALCASLALVLLVVLYHKHRSLYRNCQNLVAGLYYGLDPTMMGRSEELHPAPHCCLDEACIGLRNSRSHSSSSFQDTGANSSRDGSNSIGGGPGRVAVVTYLRDDAYAPLLQQLECTLRRTNPGLELGLLVVEGELGVATLQLARRLNITLLPVDPLDYPNTFEPKYGRNWLKVRALGLVQYDSVLLLDADVAVAGALHPLFSLPAEFAAVWDQSKWLNRYRTDLQRINGGVLLLRPCAAVEAHMIQLLERYPKLRFTHGTAEQAFFGWYYRYTGATLPVHWNSQAEQSLRPDGLTVGGLPPRIVHFTNNKPFTGPQPGGLGHQYLCSLEELSRRSMLAQHTGLLRAAATDSEAEAEQREEHGKEQHVVEGQPQDDQEQVAGAAVAPGPDTLSQQAGNPRP